jgi:hypothetical protein
MATTSKSPVPLFHHGQPIGYVSNRGVGRYLLEAESTTGFVAWKIADGTILINGAMQASIAASAHVSFWSCASYTDPTPAGRIIYFDCHGNSLIRLDVRGLTGLEYLDCSFNNLAELPLDGLVELQALDADNNQLADFEVRHLKELRVLNCANNCLTRLDLSGLAVLQVLDCSGNPLSAPKLDGCRTLKDSRGITKDPGVADAKG